ncbi:MAG: molybdenum cofactor guanylyltransferase [Myxococcota bacterium]
MKPEKPRGAVLIGGESRRMGHPKHLLTWRGRTFVERVVDALAPHVRDVVLLGEGEVPERLRGLRRLADPEGLRGPLAGLLAAYREDPDAAWVVAACDMPLVSGEAVSWLLARRSPGAAAVLPRTPDGRVHPLLAVYERTAGPRLEALARSGRRAPSRLAEDPRVLSPTTPEHLARCWVNVNDPDELVSLDR